METAPNCKKLVILPLIFFLTLSLPFLQKEGKGMNSMSSIESFVQAIDGHPDLVKKIPDELALSIPIPVIQNKGEKKPKILMAFFYYYMRGIPPGPYRISVPRYRLLVDLNTMNIISFSPVKDKDFGIEWPERKPVGEYTPAPGLTMDAYKKKKARFYQLYEQMLPYFQEDKSHLPDDQADAIIEFKTLFEELAHKPLHPFYKALNPAFFQWLDHFRQKQ